MDNRLMYLVYQTQDQWPITLEITYIDRFYNLPLMKKYFVIFLKNCKGDRVETWFTHEQWANVQCIPESGPRAHKSWS